MTLLLIALLVMSIGIGINAQAKAARQIYKYNLFLSHLQGSTKVDYLSDDIFGIARNKDIASDIDKYMESFK